MIFIKAIEFGTNVRLNMLFDIWQKSYVLS